METLGQRIYSNRCHTRWKGRMFNVSECTKESNASIYFSFSRKYGELIVAVRLQKQTPLR